MADDMEMYVVYDPINGVYAGMGSWKTAMDLKREKGGEFRMYHMVLVPDFYERTFARIFNPQPKPEKGKKK